MEQNVRLQIWETCGQENFEAIARNKTRGAFGLIYVYSITNKNSFVEMGKTWII